MEEKIFTAYEEYETFYFPKGDAESVHSGSRQPVARIMAEKAMEKHAEQLKNLLAAEENA